MTVTSLTEPKEFPLVPISGNDAPGIQWVDFAMLEGMDRTDSYCCSVTLMRSLAAGRWEHVFTRTYGWLDGRREKPAPVDAMMGWATATGFIYKAVYGDLFRQRKLNRNARILDLVGAKPNPQRYGPIPSPEVFNITVGNLAADRSGWTKHIYQSFPRRARQLGIQNDRKPEDWWHLVMTSPLQAKPGSDRALEAHGFNPIGQVKLVETVFKRPFFDVMSEVTLAPRGIDSLQMTPESLILPQPHYQRDGRTVSNARAGGNIPASTRAIAVLMATHFADGRVRTTPDAGLSYSYGSLDGSSAIQHWRGRLNWAIVFNSRRPDATHGSLHDRVIGLRDKALGKKPMLANFLYPQLVQDQKRQFDLRRSRNR